MPNDQSSKGGYFAKFIAFLMIVSGIIIIIMTVYGRTNIFHNKHKAAEFCSNCHEMTANYNTWQYTSHSEVLCTRCHKDVKPTMVALKYMTSSFKAPVKLSNFMDDGKCFQCHDKDREISPPGDLIVPHKLHAEKGVDCIDCHNNIAHGNVLKDQMENGKLMPEQVTKDVAQKQVAMNSQVRMDTCMRCHNGAKATNDCKACHKVLRAPKN